MTTSRPALSSECRITILPPSACLSRSRARKASPAERQDGPSRKNQSRPASVRKVAGLSALTNGTSKRSERWLANSVTCGSYAPISALTPSLGDQPVDRGAGDHLRLGAGRVGGDDLDLAAADARDAGAGGERQRDRRVEPVDDVRGELRPALRLDPGRSGRALQRRHQADLELLAARAGLRVVPGAAAGGDRERDGEDQGQAASPDGHDRHVLWNGGGAAGSSTRVGAGGETSAGYPVTGDTGPLMTYGDQSAADRRFASPGVHAGASGGPIVPEKYPETVSARGKVARAGGQTTRGACCCLGRAAPRRTRRHGGGAGVSWTASPPPADDRRRGTGRPAPPDPAAGPPPDGRRQPGRPAGARPGPGFPRGTGGCAPSWSRCWWCRRSRSSCWPASTWPARSAAPGSSAAARRSPSSAGRSPRWCTSCRPSATSPPATSPAGRPPNNQAKIDAAIAENETIDEANQRCPATSRRPGRRPAAERGRPAGGPAAQRGHRAGRLPGRRRRPRRRRLAGGQPDRGRPRPDRRAGVAAGRRSAKQAAHRGRDHRQVHRDRSPGCSTWTGEIGQRSGNRELSQQVAGLTALADLKETLSQERALLYSVASLKDSQGNPFGGRFQLAAGAGVLLRHRPPAGGAEPGSARTPPSRSAPSTTSWSTARRCSPSSGSRTASSAGRAPTRSVWTPSSGIRRPRPTCRPCARSRSACSTRSSSRPASCGRTPSGRRSPPA